MGSETEPAKMLLPYLQRADELQKHEPLVAYYCRLYAMDRGLRIPQKERTKTTNSILISLMNQLEKDKKTLKLGADDNLYVEGFASKIFAKADKQDRSGQASLDTAKTFYAASIFFEILSQFGEVQPEIEQKQKYAIWKAADIRKALKEGRRPQPGPPGGDKEESVSSPFPSSTYTHQDTRQDESFPSTQVDDDLSSRYVDNPSQPQNLGRSENFAGNYETADTSSNQTDKVNQHGSSHIPTSHASYSNPDYHANEYHQPPSADTSSNQTDKVNQHGSSHIPTSHASYSNPDYHANEYHQPPSAGRAEFSSYHHQYDHQQYSNEQQPIHQNYHAPENPSASYNYPNFQSYPSFHDSVFPAAPTHQPTYYHAPESSFSHQPPPPSSHTTQVQYIPGNGSTNHVAPVVPSTEIYKYDSNYQPPVEKIAEAHKAARFAVGALAFDDVATAVDFLKKSLELLTNPSAEAN